MLIAQYFFSLIARALDRILVSSINREIGCQFLISLLSFSFLPIKTIMACFCDEDSFPTSNDWFIDSTNRLPIFLKKNKAKIPQ